jgi:putative membrane protein
MTADTAADRRVHPATVPLRVIKEAPSTLLGLPAAYAYISDRGIAETAAVAGLVAFAAILYQWLAWRRFRYGIGAHELVIESGLFSRTRRSIPYDRIQDVDIERGPLARLFGLARLKIETGGSGADEGLLDSVTIAEAERLRALFQARRGQGSAAADPEPPTRELIFHMPLPRVLATGLVNFSMVYLAGLFALLQAFDDWLPFDLYEPGSWAPVQRRLEGGASPGAIAALALGLLLLGVLTGVARTLARDFGFRLTREGAGFRRERGLFTRSEVSFPVRRIQLAVLESGVVGRLLGWHQLAFQTLGAGKGEEAGRQNVAPLARMAEINRILAAQPLLAIADPRTLAMVSNRHFLRRLASGVLLPLPVILGAALWSPFALLALPLLPLVAAVAMVERRFHRYGLQGDLLFIQQGMLRRRQWAIPLSRIQSLRLSRSWLQRRLRLATLAIDTAGGPRLGAPRIVDLGEDQARALVARLRSLSATPASPSPAG